MTRKETALESVSRKIPKLEEKIKEDTRLLEELKAKKETLEFEELKKYLRDNGVSTKEAIKKLTASSTFTHEKIFTEDRKNAPH